MFNDKSWELSLAYRITEIIKKITFFNFQDYGLKKESGTFDTEKIYYLHARVKRMNTPQIYNVKLMSSNSSVKMTQ